MITHDYIFIFFFFIQKYSFWLRTIDYIFQNLKSSRWESSTLLGSISYPYIF